MHLCILNALSILKNIREVQNCPKADLECSLQIAFTEQFTICNL